MKLKLNEEENRILEYSVINLWQVYLLEEESDFDLVGIPE